MQAAKLIAVFVITTSIVLALVYFAPFQAETIRVPPPVAPLTHPAAKKVQRVAAKTQKEKTSKTPFTTPKEIPAPEEISLEEIPLEAAPEEIPEIPPQETKKAIFHSKTVPCEHNHALFMQNKKSQFKEDLNLESYFKGLCGGTYLELGALDGVLFSNSYAFNKGMNWRGVLIELVPSSFAKLKANRPNELAVVHAAVCSTQGKVHYVEPRAGGAVAGIWEFSAPSFRQRWWSQVDFKDTTEIDCMPLSTILANVQENFFADFFSLDVEGGELSVLESVDFSKAAFGIMIVEADRHSPFKNLRVRTFLQTKGYIYLRHIENSDWFVNSEFSSFYQ